MGNFVLIEPTITSVVIVIIGGYLTWIFARGLYGHPSPLLDPGIIRGDNDSEIAKDLLREDVRKIEKEMIALTDTGVDWFWGEVESDLQTLVQEKGVKLTFVVSEPEFSRSSHTTLDRLAQFDGVTVVKLPLSPEVDLRIIDDRHIHISCHGIEDETTRLYWRSTGKGAPEAWLNFWGKYVSDRLSRRYLFSCV
ncbi:MAG: hypothetical protein WDZ85_01505 [Candidatus Paceibacterota bacterium]